MRLKGYLEYPHAAKGTIHLQTSIPLPRFEPRPYGTAVSVTNHYTGWAARTWIAKTLKHNHSSQSHSSESNEACDSWDDSDDWGSDFEDETDEDDIKEEHSFSEVNNNSIIQSMPGLLENSSSNCPVLPSETLEEKFIPKPPDVPVISKVINGVSGYKNTPTNSTLRPPLKRPPSQPPPPPVSQPEENYEIVDVQNMATRPLPPVPVPKSEEKSLNNKQTFASVAELITFHLSEPILLKNRGESAGKTILRKYPEKT
ncbi:hypothetical protein TNCV_196921 [Trichonephila clavipes]|uniref:Uncharacterized protein n=1 Tax=Trichonephila clavipes TaxID=2585209 RepID=A0A8X6WJD7_TRICX|nr:hypothetical protein TNCV_196921 [Trichonephila clavipes]